MPCLFSSVSDYRTTVSGIKITPVSRSPEVPPKHNRGPAAGPENRRALLAAAREVYSERGPGAPFSAVARRAGVGQGSLYRHFPDRVALAAAVFEENVAELEAIAAPGDARLSDLFDAIVTQALPSSAFIELTTSHRQDPTVLHLGERFRTLVDRLIERERTAGRIGSHVETEDVVLVAGMLATELSRAEPAARVEVARRVRALVERAFAP
ncbi:TetR/AcrR family transcriptional regulator [Microbacterium lushaniae]|uniref:TetR/AcrR family transcriptional regulator n=1 Tax=Microbacterium lushaniae TaxID=2614639 RepID=A0A5J6L7P6_9MICO|nr:TetR/AcrR family transcriptional regulator [Microbacterium lushaniae]